MFSLRSRRRFVIPLAIMVILSVAATVGTTSSSFTDPDTSSDNINRVITDWYDLAWGYRKPITINNSGSELTDYQVNVTVNTQELISAGKMQSNCEDIRFTQADGSTGIPYWIESGINSTSTEIWIKVPSIPAGDSTIYIYYGNSIASAGTSASDTFTSDTFTDLMNDTSNIDGENTSGISVTSGETQLILADTEILDANQDSSTNSGSVYDNQWIGQTFYASTSGYLTKVTIRANMELNPPNSLEVQIRNAVGNKPGDTVYATVGRDDIEASAGNYDFSFDIAAAVTAGTQYAIVVKTTGGDASNCYNISYQESDVYPGGRALLSTDNGDSWTGYDTYDQYFRTYIATSAELDQSQIDSNADWQVYGDNWSAQSFLAGKSGDLTTVIIRASVSGSPASDLTIEVQDAEEYIEEILDQSQTSYNRNDRVYNNEWAAQTYRAGDSGDLSKITLWASEAGSPPNALTVELRNVTTGYEESEDQSQTSYSGDRQVYTSNWWSQIFQPGLSDELSKITLRASESGSVSSNLTVELRDVSTNQEENLDQSQTSTDAGYGIYGNDCIGQTIEVDTSGTMTKVTLLLQRTENEDQSQTSYSGDRQVYDTNWLAQIFQPDISDSLSQVVLRASETGSPTGDLTVELRNATLSSSSENLDQSQTSSNSSYGVYDNTYIGQTFQASTSGTLTKVALQLQRIENEDQSQTSYSGDRQVYDTNWSAQIFEPDVSDSLNRVTLRASVTGSPAGDLVVELRDATTGYTESEDQSQTSYSGDRQVYGSNWSAQIFEAGTDGELSKIVLRTSETGTVSSGLTVELRDAVLEENLDQSQTSQSGTYIIEDNTWQAQTFRAGISGQLSKVTLGVSKNTGTTADMKVEIRNCTASDLPGTIVYASSSLTAAQITTSGQYDFVFTTPASVTAGTKYAIVMSTTDANGYNIFYRNSNVYPDGRRCRSTNYGSLWSGSSNRDFAFQTYISTGAYIPGTTVHATATNSGITATPGEYDFTFSSPYSVTTGTRYAMVIYTSSGDAGNYYNISYRNSNVYADGRECSSTNSGTDWAGSDSTDLYFRTYIQTPTGYTPGSTVYASASRSDITSAGEYDFTFSSPYSVTAGTKYAMVIYTSGGDAGNYYNISYQNSDTYSDGRECSSTNNGADWTGNDSADLYFRTKMGTLPGALEVELRDCTVDDLPGTTVYASASIDMADIGTSADTYDFTYSSPASVVAGTKYAIVIKTTNGDSNNNYVISYQNTNVYADGRACLSNSGGSSWDGYAMDAYFQTYVTSGSYEPGSTVYATASRSDITSAGEYEFTFSSPYSVTAGTKYAMVIYTSGGDASNYYNISYENSNAYSDGVEYSSNNSGTDWTVSTATDLYFKTIMGSIPDAIEVQIRNCTIDDLPGTTVYASASIDKNGISTSANTYDFVFSTPPSVIAGVKYAIVIKTSNGDINNSYLVGYQSTDVYTDGSASLSTDGGSSWSGYAVDIYFQDYITITAYLPGSTVYATASRSDVNPTAEYDFVFASPYSVTAGTKYAIVIYTSGGDASNYYTISYQNSDAYSDGRECSSTNNGTDWTGNDSSDLFFRTFITVEVGDTPGTTVYASASRSDITTAREYDFVFGTPYSVTAETNYAIVIYTTGGDNSNYYNVAYQNSDLYALGKKCSSGNGGSSWSAESAYDLYFKTYISSATGKYLPGGTVYASTSRSNIGSSIQDYIFDFSTPASITSGNRYTLIVKTSGGDAVNCYNVAYQNVNVYGSGERSYSTDGGTGWTMTDYDLFFKTYVEYGRAVSASGTLTSVPVHADTGTRFAVGIELSWSDVEQTNSDILYQVEYYTGSDWSLIPDDCITGNSTGLDNSPVDLSSIKIDYYQLRLKASLSSTYITDAPSIQDWTVNYYYRKYTSTEPTIAEVGGEE